MSATAVAAPGSRAAPPLYALAIFTSAALVFLVEPMIAKLVLPKLGGSPAVWNTSMVFFQAALLAGYGYAHAVQRVRSIRTQIVIHVGLLLLAALVLPLKVSGLLGDPPTGMPIPWLLGVLTLSIGAPFAVLSATAPLLQAWYARVRKGYPDAENPYVLYAASNLGSFAALLAYPTIVEPLLRLTTQRTLWSGAYFVFIALIAVLAFISWRASDEETAPLAATTPVTWRERLIWLALAAIPSSLMLGVTMHLSMDIASAPFLWVAPLAVYLLTFVLAFQSKPLIPLKWTLILQGLFAAACVALLPFNTGDWVTLFALNLATFFFTALMCHQTLAARRPPPDRLTEFYLWLSLGGVLGGVFNAILAPLIFHVIWEYPIVLVLAGLVRPRGEGKASFRDKYAFGTALALAAACFTLFSIIKAHPEVAVGMHTSIDGFRDGYDNAVLVAHLLLGAGSIAAFLIRDRAVLFTIALAALWIGAQDVAGRYHWLHTERSFFGVLRTASQDTTYYGKPLTLMLNGSTLHGAQANNDPRPEIRCHPMLYYAQVTPIGQTVAMIQRRMPAADIGVVGLGSGALAAYKRASDHLTYFEIDPKVLHFAFDPSRFSYTTYCARGGVAVVMGDARLTLAKQPRGRFDVLMVDAFSSDSVPTHLLTTEALKGYLDVVKPGGVVLLHLSNRNLEITTSAVATAKAIGAPVLQQVYLERASQPYGWEASTEAVLFARTPEALADFRADKRWQVPPASKTKPWTDDYTNLIGALWRHIQQGKGK